MKHNSATTIKCRFSNEVHKMIDPYYGIKRSERWRCKIAPLTKKEKAEMFDKIMKLHTEISNELSACYFKRREKKRIQKYRDESGYTAKKREKKLRQKAFHHSDVK